MDRTQTDSLANVLAEHCATPDFSLEGSGMPSQYAVVEIDLTESSYPHVGLHVLWLPTVSEPGFYRQVCSFDAFFTSVNRRNKSSKRLYHARRWEEFVEECDRLKESFRRYGEEVTDDRDLPTVEHNDIWAFYQHVGFDYKKKTWK